MVKSHFFFFTKDNALENFSNGFNNFLKRKKLKSLEVAKELNLKNSSVSMWKTRRGFPEFAKLCKLFEIGFTLKEAFGEKLTNKIKENEKNAVEYFTPKDLTDWINKPRTHLKNSSLLDELSSLPKSSHKDDDDARALAMAFPDMDRITFFVLRSKVDGKLKRDAYGKVRRFYSEEAARNARSEYETWSLIDIVSSLNLTLKDFADSFDLFKNCLISNMSPGVPEVSKPRDVHVEIPRMDVMDSLGVKAISSIVGKKFDEQIEEFGKAHGFPVIFVFYNRKEEMDDDNVSRSTFTVQLFEKNMMRRATDFARNYEGELGVYYPRSAEEKYKAELMQQPVL